MDYASHRYICGICHSTIVNRYMVVPYHNQYYCSDCYQYYIDQIHGNQKNMKEEKEQEELNMEITEETESTDVFLDEEVSDDVRSGLTPKEIEQYLDHYVIGQQNAKKTLAVAFCNHYRRVCLSEHQVSLPKTNILIKGDTGCGKTYLVKKIARFLDIPFYETDASLLTEAAYRGKDIESILIGLYEAAGCDLEKAKKGVIFLDEFDKLSSKYGHSSNGSDCVGVGVQRQLLKIIEGCVTDVSYRNQTGSRVSFSIDSKDILFICAGAFVTMNEMNFSQKQMGFSLHINEKKPVSNLKPSNEDFIEFGLIPEIIGRLPMKVFLDKLTMKDLGNILIYSKDSILKSYEMMLAGYGVELAIDEEAVLEIANQAFLRNVGARGLQTVVEELMLDILYEVLSYTDITKCVISKDVVLGKEPVLLERTKESA